MAEPLAAVVSVAYTHTPRAVSATSTYSRVPLLGLSTCAPARVEAPSAGLCSSPSLIPCLSKVSFSLGCFVITNRALCFCRLRLLTRLAVSSSRARTSGAHAIFTLLCLRQMLVPIRAQRSEDRIKSRLGGGAGTPASSLAECRHQGINLLYISCLLGGTL